MVCAGDVVLDCGANVGAFARVAAPAVGPAGTVYAVEPIPDVCAALELNIRAYDEWAAKRGLAVGRVIAVSAGVGGADGQVEREFAYYPRLTAMSSMYPDDADAAQATLSLVMHRSQCYSALEAAGKALARCALPRMESPFLRTRPTLPCSHARVRLE
jgi:FkbM family methyltransferase